MKKSKKIESEFELIEDIRKWLGAVAGKGACVKLGIGDDAGLFSIEGKTDALITTDLLVEGVHFRSSWTTPYLLGRKAISINISDIASMGGRPKVATICLAIPPHITGQFLKDFHRGVKSASKSYGIKVIGGDISASPSGFIVGVSVVGEEGRDGIWKRSGARQGDRIFISGTVGDSAMGLTLLKSQKKPTTLEPIHKRALISSHLDPMAQARLSLALNHTKAITAAIDTSDGLVQDLRHLLDSSGVGAEIYIEKLPLSKAFIAASKALRMGKSSIDIALSGGEDYGLILTVKKDRKKQVLSAAKKCGKMLTDIGVIRNRSYGLKIFTSEGKSYKPKVEGFDHFRI